MGYIAELMLDDDPDDEGDGDFVRQVVVFENPDVGVDRDLGLQRIRLRVADEDYDADPGAWDPETDGPGYVDMVGFAVGDDGSVSVIINNQKVTIARIAVAMFSNPGGLDKAGNSLYRQTASSGDAQIGQALENGAGKVIGGGLEMSNVDLATEFTDMIVTQRGFQANSRIITVSDTMLEELVNLKR
jgi:flagellar hook protein FlgE